MGASSTLGAWCFLLNPVPPGWLGAAAALALECGQTGPSALRPLPPGGVTLCLNLLGAADRLAPTGLQDGWLGPGEGPGAPCQSSRLPVGRWSSGPKPGRAVGWGPGFHRGVRLQRECASPGSQGVSLVGLRNPTGCVTLGSPLQMVVVIDTGQRL